MRIAKIFMMIVLLNGTSAGTDGAAEHSNEEQKTIYDLGLIITHPLAPFSLTESELDFVRAGMTDGVLKKTPKVELQTYGPKVNQVQQARAAAQAETEKKAGAAYIEKATKEAGAKKTESGAI